MADSWRPADTARRAAIESEICRCVQFALRCTMPSRIKHERRRETRHPFPYPIQLTPVDLRGGAIGESLCVIGKHLSNHGLDFYFQQPVPYRRVVAALSAGGDQHVSMLMDLTWCRFSGHGWYENGGRFLAVYEPQATAALPPVPALTATRAPQANAIVTPHLVDARCLER